MFSILCSLQHPSLYHKSHSKLEFVRSVITKSHRLSSLNNKKVLFQPYNSGGWRSKIKIPIGFIPSEAPLCRLQMDGYILKIGYVYKVEYYSLVKNRSCKLPFYVKT